MKHLKKYKNMNESTIDTSTLKDRKWYWILIKDYSSPTPCWCQIYNDEIVFLPGGLGDSSSMGIYMDEIERIGPEILEPKF